MFLVLEAGYSPSKAGLVLFSREIMTTLAQAKMGDHVDKTTNKKGLLVVVSIVCTLLPLVIILTTTFWVLIVKLMVEGVFAAAIEPAKAAITLGVVGPAQFEKWSARNE